MSKEATNPQKSEEKRKSSQGLTIENEELAPALSARYDFLNDKDSRKKISKIKKEIALTIRKIKRKTYDRKMLGFLSLGFTCLLLALFANQQDFLNAITIAVGTAYILIAYLLFTKIIQPINTDLAYLRSKKMYLEKKFKASANHLGMAPSARSSMSNEDGSSSDNHKKDSGKEVTF